jgi:hypothetical protein
MFSLNSNFIVTGMGAQMERAIMPRAGHEKQMGFPDRFPCVLLLLAAGSESRAGGMYGVYLSLQGFLARNERFCKKFIGYSDAPAMAIAPNGTPYVAWTDNSDGDGETCIRGYIE